MSINSLAQWDLDKLPHTHKEQLNWGSMIPSAGTQTLDNFLCWSVAPLYDPLSMDLMTRMRMMLMMMRNRKKTIVLLFDIFKI